MKRRVYIVYSVALILVIIVLGRLVKLQVVDSSYKREAIANSRNVVTVRAPRETFWIATGILLQRAQRFRSRTLFRR